MSNLHLNHNFTYYRYGENILEQGLFVKDLKKLGFVASIVGPGIGWIFVFIFLIFGPHWLSVFIVSAVISSLITVYIYKIGKLLFNKEVVLLVGFMECNTYLFPKICTNRRKGFMDDISFSIRCLL